VITLPRLPELVEQMFEVGRRHPVAAVHHLKRDLLAARHDPEHHTALLRRELECIAEQMPTICDTAAGPRARWPPFGRDDLEVMRRASR